MTVLYPFVASAHRSKIRLCDYIMNTLSVGAPLWTNTAAMPAPDKKSKARKSNFHYHVPPKAEKTSTNHRYIQYSSNAGLVSVSTSSVQTPVLLQPGDNLSEINQVEFEPIDIHTVSVNSGEDDAPPIDPAYLTHMEEQEGFETLEKVKRFRSKGVWLCSLMIYLRLTLAYCTGSGIA